LIDDRIVVEWIGAGLPRSSARKASDLHRIASNSNPNVLMAIAFWAERGISSDEAKSFHHSVVSYPVLPLYRL
jgi:hypothetical protein